MNRDAKRHWIEIVGLLTAIVGLASAYVALRNTQASVQQAADNLTERTDEYANKMAIDAKHHDEELKCDQHQVNIAAIDTKFSTLLQDHPILMNSLKQCANDSNSDEGAKCGFAVCAASQIFSGGGCPDVASTFVSLTSQFQSEKAATLGDQCTLMQTSMQHFLEDK